MRRSLERCGYLSGAACLVVAVDDSFVIPVPTLAKAVGFYRPEGLVGAQPDERAEAGRRLAAATDGWNAVAVGAAGHVGTTIGAASERSAVDGAIEDCASRDHNCRIAVIGPFLVEAPPATAEAVAAPPSAANPSPANLAGREAGHVELVPALVPFVIEKDKERIRNEYMSAPNYKALATSLLKMAFVSGQPSQEAADHGAMEACEKANGPVGTGTEAKTDRICDLYASGTFVVTHRNAPALPPMPWINASVTRPFDVSAVPMLDLKKKGPPDGYPGFARSKAMVLSPNGIWYGTFAQSSPDEAMRRSLERCGYTHGAACLVVAVDDSFVIPVPTLAKAVEFYRPEALVGAQPDERKEVGRRLAGANAGWNAVAVGAAGHLGTKIGAASERSAVDGAMEDCANRDRNCRIAVIGPFLVEALPASVARAAPP
jgi:adenylate cyclase